MGETVSKTKGRGRIRYYFCDALGCKEGLQCREEQGGGGQLMSSQAVRNRGWSISGHAATKKVFCPAHRKPKVERKSKGLVPIDANSLPKDTHLYDDWCVCRTPSLIVTWGMLGRQAIKELYRLQNLYRADTFVIKRGLIPPGPKQAQPQTTKPPAVS